MRAAHYRSDVHHQPRPRGRARRHRVPRSARRSRSAPGSRRTSRWTSLRTGATRRSSRTASSRWPSATASSGSACIALVTAAGVPPRTALARRDAGRRGARRGQAVRVLLRVQPVAATGWTSSTSGSSASRPKGSGPRSRPASRWPRSARRCWRRRAAARPAPPAVSSGVDALGARAPGGKRAARAPTGRTGPSSPPSRCRCSAAAACP